MTNKSTIKTVKNQWKFSSLHALGNMRYDCNLCRGRFDRMYRAETNLQSVYWSTKFNLFRDSLVPKLLIKHFVLGRKIYKVFHSREGLKKHSLPDDKFCSCQN